MVIGIIQVIALGEPAQKVVTVEIEKAGSIEYFEDDDKVHFVPKRFLSEIVID